MIHHGSKPIHLNELMDAINRVPTVLHELPDAINRVLNAFIDIFHAHSLGAINLARTVGVVNAAPTVLSPMIRRSIHRLNHQMWGLLIKCKHHRLDSRIYQRGSYIQAQAFHTRIDRTLRHCALLSTIPWPDNLLRHVDSLRGYLL